MQGSLYTDEQRRQAVVAYQVLGNLRELERQTGIPNETLGAWKRSDWWNELAAQVNAEVRDEITASLTRAVQTSIKHVEDRLANGDTVVSKGELVRIPVRCRDLAVTTAILFDKRQLLMNQPTAIREGGGLADFAARLVQAFAESQRSNERLVEGSVERVAPQVSDR